MQCRDHVAASIRHRELDDARQRPQSRGHRLEQLVDAFAGEGRDRNRARVRTEQRADRVGIGGVDLVHDDELGHVPRADLSQNPVHRLDLGLALVGARVDHVQQQVGVGDLLECRSERLDELVREPAHEADRVREQDDLAAEESKAARRRIERGEEPVLHEHAGLGDPVQQRRLARVGVTDQGDRRHRTPSAGFALRRARRREALEAVLELRDPAQDSTAVDLELGLAGTPGADAGSLLTQGETTAAQAREPVPELRELDLHHAFLTARVLGEDVEDERDPVDDVAGEQLLEVALLRGAELVVEDHDVDVEGLGERAQLLGLALADVGGGVRCVAPLQHPLDRFGARGVGEQAELVERRLGFVGGPRPRAASDQQGSLAYDAEIDLGCGEAPPLAPLARRTHRLARVGRNLKSSRSTVVSNTWATGPPRRMVSPSSTWRSPPGTWTTTRSPTSPCRLATAAAAHAPVPQLRVSPTPRSQTRMSIPSASPGVAAMNSTFVRLGNRSSCSRWGPCWVTRAVPGLRTRLTRWGLPMPAASPT